MCALSMGMCLSVCVVELDRLDKTRMCVCVCVFALRVRKSVKMWSECVCGYDCMKCVCVCDHLLNK